MADKNNPVGYGSTSESAISGGLAGLLASTVFGGPVGLAIGLGAGLLSEKMRRTAIDVAMDDQSAIQDYGSSIQQSMSNSADYVHRYGDPSGSDEVQFKTLSDHVTRATALSQHFNQQLRDTGLKEMSSADASLGAFQKDLESRTQVKADREYATLRQGAEYYQGIIDNHQDQQRALFSKVEQANNQVGTLGPDDPLTKASMMDLVNMNPRAANADAYQVSGGLPFGIGNVSFDVNQWHPTPDQAYKLIASIRETTIKSMGDYIASVTDNAKQHGYTFDATPDGIKVGNQILSTIQDFRATPGVTGGPTGSGSSAPASTNPAPLGPAFDKANSAIRGADYSAFTNKPAPENSAINNPLIQDVEKKGSEAINQTMQFIHRRTNRTKRPTN